MSEKTKRVPWHWKNGCAVTDESRDKWAAEIIETTAVEGEDAAYSFRMSGDSMVIGLARDGGEGEPPHLEIYDVVIRRHAKVFSESAKLAAALVLHQHIAECDQCSGPNDGCERGAGYESACIDVIGFDPYEKPYSEATADSVVGAAVSSLKARGE